MRPWHRYPGSSSPFSTCRSFHEREARYAARHTICHLVPTTNPCGRTAGVSQGDRRLPVEAPVAISFCGIGYAVMMATPVRPRGFRRRLRPLGAADRRGGRRGRDRRPARGRWPPARHRAQAGAARRRVRAGAAPDRRIELRPVRNRESRAGAAAAAAGGRAAARGNRGFCSRRWRGSGRHQPLNLETGAVHGAAFFDAGGALVAAREDVGRHNAFDKLIGHGMRTGIDLAAGFALLTARCSYELVEKAALAGIPLLVTVSAPTDLAVRRARGSGADPDRVGAVRLHAPDDRSARAVRRISEPPCIRRLAPCGSGPS